MEYNTVSFIHFTLLVMAASCVESGFSHKCTVVVMHSLVYHQHLLVSVVM